ncbi:MAG TPA: hypothetical protein VLL52_22370, partial [Anaerolineae bacterium]|nr:hypothetical protein [Anaerolineae bacterium]
MRPHKPKPTTLHQQFSRDYKTLFHYITDELNNILPTHPAPTQLTQNLLFELILHYLLASAPHTQHPHPRQLWNQTTTNFYQKLRL